MSAVKTYTASELGLNAKSVPQGVMQICETLQKNQFDAYLVGGCIRDWLMGKSPKDFDISTNATPEQVKRLFKRSRIIGRRFKIVHVYLNYREYIEIATFRAAPVGEGQHAQSIHSQNDKGRLVRDNVYGTIEEDAFRRDFSANALYYDPTNTIVLDYTGGLQAIKQRKLEVIGRAEQRFAEDPVRMLRALRFMAKLGFEISPDLSQLIHAQVHLIHDVSNARLYDETFKLFHHAHGVKSWSRLKEYGLVDILFPLTANSLSKQTSQPGNVDAFIDIALKNTDRRVGQNKPVIPAFFFAVILWHAFQYQRKNSKSLPKGRQGTYIVADKIILEQIPRIAIPKRVSMVVMEIWDMQHALEQRRPKQILRILENKRFRAAYDFLLLRQKIDEAAEEITVWWTKIQDVDESARLQMIQALPQAHGRNKPNRKRSNRSRRNNNLPLT